MKRPPITMQTVNAPEPDAVAKAGAAFILQLIEARKSRVKEPNESLTVRSARHQSMDRSD
jgi:hypothetical protein